MTPRNHRSSAEAIENLRQEIADLRDHIRVLTDVLDEIRDELHWVTRNGLPRGEPPPSLVLKQMAADPCAPDWGERLVIECGDRPARQPQPGSPSDTASIVPKPPAGKLFAEPGEQSEAI